MTIRIANGECVARSLREICPQDEILPFNEAMCEGEYCLPVYGDAFCSMRAEAYGVSLTDYLKKSPRGALRTIGRFGRAELYFDGDMFCAVNALTLLAFLEQEGYSGELWFNHIEQDASATVLSRSPLPKIGWVAAYECIFLKKQPCKTGVALFDDALPLFFAYKQTDNELLRYAREHAEREESALLRDMMERFRPYGLSDCAAKRFIDRAKEPL